MSSIETNSSGSILSNPGRLIGPYGLAFTKAMYPY